MSNFKSDSSEGFFLRMQRAVDIIGLNAVICFVITSIYGNFVLNNPTSWYILFGIPPFLIAIALSRKQMIVLAMSVIFFASTTILMFYSIRLGEESYTHVNFILIISGISLLYAKRETRIHFYLNALYLLCCIILVFLSYSQDWFESFKDPFVNPVMQRHINFLFLVACSIVFTSVIAITNQRQHELMQRSIEEQKVLLSELNHRVKNNLTVITSLLNMQKKKARSKETRHAIEIVQNRVMSMALVHLKMYENENKSDIDLEKYIRELGNEIHNSMQKDRTIRIDYNLENVKIDVSLAIPMGLIINELITNSLKHAFDETEVPCIGITLVKEGDRFIQLTVRDNGKGINPNFENTASGLGLDLIKSLTDQLDGKSTMQNENGVHFKLVMPYNG